MHRRDNLRRCIAAEDTPIRAAQTLVFTQADESILGFNYLSKNSFMCSADLFYILKELNDWLTPDEIMTRYPEVTPETLQELTDADILVKAGSTLAEAEAQIEGSWTWGMPAALFHFCTQDVSVLPLDHAEAMQIEKAKACPSPALVQSNSMFQERVELPRTLGEHPLLDLMACRRTVREAADRAVDVVQLSDCLFAGLGITGETTNCVGTLPLSMTPSGGARNPYEAYVFARQVDGLDPGIYHYSASEHTLGLVPGSDLPDFATATGGQSWAAPMPALIVLCADLERTMWKYSDGNAYRVVLIEAGHIAQNIMLAATWHGLSACPTAALSHSLIKTSIGADRLTVAPIYAMTLGHPLAAAPMRMPDRKRGQLAAALAWA